MLRELHTYNAPYPLRNDENIQSLIYSKKEFRDCISEDKIASGIVEGYFNTQVLVQRYVSAFGSVLLWQEAGSGKTGAYEYYRKYMKENRPGEISTFYYIAPETQIKDFERQVTYEFDSKISEIDANSPKTKSEKTEIRHSMASKNYSTMTYIAFSNLIKSMKTKQQIIKEFSSVAVMIDEAQFMKLTESKDSSGNDLQRQRLEVYTEIMKVSILCPQCVFIIATGTPITNEISEFIHQANLIPGIKQIRTKLSQKIVKTLKESMQIEYKLGWHDIDLDSADAQDQLEKALRGYIMYSKSPTTDAIEAYIPPDSKKKEYNHKRIQYDEDLAKYITLVYMSKFQTRGYMSVSYAGGHKDQIFIKSSQACTFVVPTEKYAIHASKYGVESAESKFKNNLNGIGMVGDKGFKECMVLKTREMKYEYKYNPSYTPKKEREILIKYYEPKPWFKEYLSKDNCLRNSSVKIYDIVKQAIDDDVGPMYIASRFYHTGCLYIAAALNSKDFEELKLIKQKLRKAGIISFPADKRNRFAIINKDNKDDHQTILNILKDPRNVKGKYLKVVMVTQVGSVGLNIFNIERCFLLEPQFTPAQETQTIKRIFRPNSHVEGSKLMKEKGINYFPVYISYYVSYLDQEEVNIKPPEGNIIDDASLDIEEKRTKEIDITQEDFFSQNLPEYEEEEELPSVDYSIYNQTKIKNDKIYRVMMMLKRIAADYSINTKRNIRQEKILVDEKVIIKDAEIYESYPKLKKFPIDKSTYNSYYINTDLREIIESLKLLFLKISLLSGDNILKYYSRDEKYSNLEIITAIRSIIENDIVLSLDNLGFPLYLRENNNIFYTTRDQNVRSDRSLSFYTKISYMHSKLTLNDIEVDYISKSISDAKRREIEEGDNIIANISNVYKANILEEDILSYLIDNSKTMSMKKLKYLWMKMDDESIVHQISSVYDSGTNYNPINSIFKAKEGFRILRKGSLEWKSATKEECNYYYKYLNDRLERELVAKYKKFKNIGAIGVITRPGVFHIKEFKEVKDAVVEIGSGKDAKNSKKHEILRILYSAEHLERDPSKNGKNRQAILNSVMEMLNANTKVKIRRSLFNNETDEQLNFYNNVLKKLANDTSISLVKMLAEALYKRNAIFNLLGDTEDLIDQIN
jgi:hypothetical protein